MAARTRGMWTIRRATLRDLPALEGLCRAAAGTDDYVIPVLGFMVRRRHTYLALDGARAIGTLTFHEVLDGSGWLSAARTHPDYRGLGVAGALIAAFESLGRRRGLSCLRLWTSASNDAGQASFRKSGFEEKARFTRLTAPAEREGTPPTPRRLPASPALRARLDASPIVRAGNGYACYRYDFLALDPRTLSRLARRGALQGWDGHVALLVREAFPGEGSFLEAGPLAGDVEEILRGARAVAGRRRLSRVETFLPHAPDLLRAAARVGYTPLDWGHEAILCEKPVTRRGPGPQASQRRARPSSRPRARTR